MPEDRLEWLHNLSQFAHCLAQGKVGSGFDVSSAVFGSQRFTRASSSILAPLLAAENPFSPGELSAFAGELSVWDNVHDSFCLPKGMRLLMGDVNAGSSTPGMVKSVLRWLETGEKGSSPLPHSFSPVMRVKHSAEQDRHPLTRCLSHLCLCLIDSYLLFFTQLHTSIHSHIHTHPPTHSHTRTLTPRTHTVSYRQSLSRSFSHAYTRCRPPLMGFSCLQIDTLCLLSRTSVDCAQRLPSGNLLPKRTVKWRPCWAVCRTWPHHRLSTTRRAWRHLPPRLLLR